MTGASGPRSFRRALLLVALVLAAGAAVVDRDAPAAHPAIEPLDVARAIRDGSRLRLVDARDSSDRATIALAAAERAEAGVLAGLAVTPGDTIVVVATADDQVRDAMDVLRTRGAVVLAMRGGTQGWIDEVLAPLPPAASAGAAEHERHREALALSRWFGGLPSSAALEGQGPLGRSGNRPAARRIFRGC